MKEEEKKPIPWEVKDPKPQEVKGEDKKVM